MTQTPPSAEARVRYVARELAFAREHVRRLARQRGALAGWDATTLRALAAELAEDALAQRGLAVADDVALADLAGVALDECATSGTLPSAVAEQVATVGLRNAVWDAIGQLRVAGVAPAALTAVARRGSAAAATAVVLERYERLLAERALADPATVLRLALDAALTLPGTEARALRIEHGAAEVTGLVAEFVRRLADRGAVLEPPLHDTPTYSDDALTLDLFRAATPADEVREVLRRVVHEGLRWDEVELAVTDTDTYGVALAALGTRLGIPFTLKEGVPLARTRIGRGQQRFLEWLSSGLSDTCLREMLESGDVSVPGLDDEGICEAVHAIRLARVGWGRDRLDAARARFANGEWAQGAELGRDAPDDNGQRSAKQEQLRRRATAAVRALDALLAITPPVPALGAGATSVQITASALARAALGWLALAEGSVTSDDERATVERLRARLEALERNGSTTLHAFDAAMAALRLGLADQRAFPSVSGARAPRTSLPGAVHLTHASHAGVTGRARVFVLGLDADRAGGARLPDPILDDRTREALGGAMDTTSQRAERKQRLMRRAMAGLTGRVTLSYADSTDGAGGNASPSAIMLGAMRALAHDPTLSYDDFRKRIGAPAAPASDSVPLDGRDAWLAALAAGPVMLDGTAAVREAFPALARGLDVQGEANSVRAGEWHGLALNAAHALGPVANPGQTISASSMELLAKCPLAWFYSKGLGLRPPDDVAFEPGQWLDPMQRGSLLHTVFEQFVNAWRHRRSEIAGEAAARDARDLLMAQVAMWRRDVPPPSEMVFERERRLLEKLLDGFLAAERDDLARGRTANWLATELEFPSPDAQDPVHFDAGHGMRFRVRGFVDRVDELPDGSLRVVDYKTGSAYKYKREGAAAPFNNGRLLQPSLYAAAVVQLLDRVVARFEYRFPAERPPHDRVYWRADELPAGGALARSLLGEVAAGAFVATDDPNDCRYCDFKNICRVRDGQYATRSPRAEWAKAHGAGDLAYAAMRARRGSDDA